MVAAAASLPPGWRRLVACLIDYIVFVLPLLALLTVVGMALASKDADAPTLQGWTGHAVMLVCLTLPVALYFAVLEASLNQATVGKRLMKLSVVASDGGRASPGQTLLRVAGKLAPWEFFHAVLWHWDGWPFDPAPASSLQMTGLLVGWVVVGVYIVSVFVGERRTPYDQLAGTSVLYRGS
ncbi:MAG: RDD family protein [Pseudomonadota bacterium]